MAPGSSSEEVQQQTGEHFQRAKAGWLALTQDNGSEQLAQLGMTIRERDQHIQQWRLAVPVADVLAEAEHFREPLVQRCVIRAWIYVALQQVLRGDLARLECVVNALAGEWVDQAGGFSHQQGPLG